MKADTDPEYTDANPDLKGFDLAALAGLGAYYDGSGGGIRTLAWELKRLRETQERIDRLRAFVHQYQVTLARLSWSLNVSTLHPKDTPDRPFVCEIEIAGHIYNKQAVQASEIAALWPEAAWVRSMPKYGINEGTQRDYTAEVDGVILRITRAEQLPPPVKVNRFGPCGPVRIRQAAKAKG